MCCVYRKLVQCCTVIAHVAYLYITDLKELVMIQWVKKHHKPFSKSGRIRQPLSDVFLCRSNDMSASIVLLQHGNMGIKHGGQLSGRRKLRCCTLWLFLVNISSYVDKPRRIEPDRPRSQIPQPKRSHPRSSLGALLSTCKLLWNINIHILA